MVVMTKTIETVIIIYTNKKRFFEKQKLICKRLGITIGETNEQYNKILQ